MSWVRLSDVASLGPEEQALALAGALFDLIVLQIILALHGPVPAASAYAMSHHRIRVSPDQGEVLIWAPERQES